MAKKGSEAVGEEKGKDVTDALVMMPVVEREECQENPIVVAEKEEQMKIINGKGKAWDVKSGKDVQPPSLYPTIPSSVGPAAPRDKKLKEALRLKWTRGATTTKDEEITRNLTNDALNQ
ncbi:hypothetical protein Dimus_005891 [Dionaea muscipula]